VSADVTGYEVEALDGHIGKVDEANNETASSLLIVDWVFGKMRMIPAGVVERIDDTNQRVHVAMSKDQIKNAPDYDPDRYRDNVYRRQVGDYYRPYGRS
jgi:hypothetical protein